MASICTAIAPPTAGTLRGLDEEGVIVYPIRYDTRAETERMVRQQAEEAGPQLPTIGVIQDSAIRNNRADFPERRS